MCGKVYYCGHRKTYYNNKHRIIIHEYIDWNTFILVKCVYDYRIGLGIKIMPH